MKVEEQHRRPRGDARAAKIDERCDQELVRARPSQAKTVRAPV
jgi:hypothetical protein